MVINTRVRETKRIVRDEAFTLDGLRFGFLAILILFLARLFFARQTKIRLDDLH
jgi:hypothetical protein